MSHKEPYRDGSPGRVEKDDFSVLAKNPKSKQGRYHIIARATSRNLYTLCGQSFARRGVDKIMRINCTERICDLCHWGKFSCEGNGMTPGDLTPKVQWALGLGRSGR